MKTKFIINFAALTMSLCSYSQIKIFSGGSVTIGATTSPTANAVTHQVVGGTIAFPGTTSAATSAPLIVGQNAVSSSPGFAFLGDYQTGIAHPASGVLAITIANSEKFRVNSSNQILSVNTTSSASTPDFSWNGDGNTGVYHPNVNDVLGFVAGGNEAFRINSSRQILSSNNYSVASASAPDYSWKDDTNTGMYRDVSDQLAFSTNGVQRLRISDNGQLRSFNAPGTASAPDYSWGADNNTGMFNASNDILGFSTGGTERMRINNNGNLLIGTTTDLSIKLVITGTSNQDVQANWATHTSDWGYCQVNHVDRGNTKAFAVKSTATGTEVENFTVMGWGGVYSNGYYSISDKTMKENIDSLQNSLDKIKLLKGVKYNLKQSLTGLIPIKTEIGLLAQDVETVVPEVVMTNEKGIKCIAYQNLVPLLIEAIKAQDKQIAQLKNDVNNCCAKTGNSQQNRFTNTTNEATEPYTGDSYIKQNAPNPFSKETTIDYFVAERNSFSSILVFDMNGKLLKTFKLNGNGNSTLTISTNDFQPGMYYYSLIINAKEVGTKKMVLTE